MTTSHADKHDHDKLARWYQDLSSNPSNPPFQKGAKEGSLYESEAQVNPPLSQRGGFPLYAIFLVSERDRAAHDIFRQFRSSFEARNAGFEHLVIFGQHGISSTVRDLLAEFGWPIEAIPVLALFAAGLGAAPRCRIAPTEVCSLPLPAESDGNPPSEQPWLKVLAGIEAAADEGREVLELASLPELRHHQLGGRPLVEVVGRLLAGPG
jgi:hypothetical protein